ncbi:MAG: hypothetical protein KGI90_03195 [Burkholderiales bacterium]|nr:hypothetical protein [Burkholderiales bacterium]MDE2277684.1 hypothetical protein [Burkholderiales bacterium]
MKKLTLVLACGVALQAAAAPGTNAGPVDAQAAVPPLQYRSAFADYKPYRAAEAGDWKTLNSAAAGMAGMGDMQDTGGSKAPADAQGMGAMKSMKGMGDMKDMKDMGDMKGMHSMGDMKGMHGMGDMKGMHGMQGMPMTGTPAASAPSAAARQSHGGHR